MRVYAWIDPAAKPVCSPGRWSSHSETFCGSSREDRSRGHDGDREVVGEMSVITEKPRMVSLIAVGDVRILSIERARFERILAERPEVSLAVMSQLCARLEQQSI
jgi:hypothetical protein